jgi:hexosaminidase
MTTRRFAIVSLLLPAALAACAKQPQPALAPAPVVREAPLAHSLIPLPRSVALDSTRSFTFDTATAVFIDPAADSATAGVARYLIAMFNPVLRGDVRRAAPMGKSVHLRIDPASTAHGDEGYELNTSLDRITISARTATGLFYGVQTLRQLLPVSIEHRAALARRLVIPAGVITDSPRYAWRGLMLDVSRHFLPAGEVKRFIDLMALYKLNRLHLHLSDDQGWRLEIKSRPTLAAIGGSTQVGGGPGGFYTQAEYSDIVAHAASRFITIVPEIDMPGHTNAALASIPELNCDGVAPPLYTGIRVGFSTVCADSARIYPILEDIIREISALTPGPYFHIGGDEVEKLTHPQYLRFIERMQGIVNAHGKRMIGWGEIAPAGLSPNTIVQNWKRDSSFVHAARGGKVIMSPSARVYLDMKYDSSTVLGLAWAGLVGLRTSYDWDPGTFIAGVPDSAVLGVEGPLWSETLVRPEDWESMAFPRAMAVAEVGWSDQASRSWPMFRRRIALHESRLDALGVNAPLAAAIKQSPGQDVFWQRLQSLCGKAFAGKLTDSNASDSVFARSPVVMHVRNCSPEEIRIPLHVGNDRSRTWVITPADGGLRLKHDHRHRDGSEDAVTQYGGDTMKPGGPSRQEFYADSLTASLIPAARTNVWTIEIVPDKTFAYGLRREGTDRKFRVEFDLTKPVPAPPAPWGSR